MGPNHRASGHFVYRLDLYDVVVEIDAPRALAPWLSLLLRAYPRASAGTATDVRIVVRREGPMWRIIDDGRTYDDWYPETPNAGSAALQVEWLVVSEAVKRWTNFVHVHAALVATTDQSALLVGRSGSGKSTTSVALALAGLDLYTDDLALLDRGTMRPVCFPRPIKLDRTARRLLQERGLVLPRRSSLRDSIDRTVLPGLPPIGVPGPPLSTAIFFAGQRGERVDIRPLTSAEAVVRLIAQSASEHIDANGPSEGAVNLINSVRCFELIPADLDSTVDVILNILATQSDTIATERTRQREAIVA